ncbi:MAG: hypothetical protein ABIK28_10095, partial [Planctomycetota bacterium]
DKRGKQEDVDCKPWVFSENSIATADEKGRVGHIDVMYFKIGEVLLVDSVAAKDRNIPEMWAFHVMPVHMLCKVQLDGDSLVFIPLNCEWLDKQRDKGELGLPFVEVKKNHAVYTASTDQWQAFLEENLTNPDLFAKDKPLTFRKFHQPESE